MGLDLRSFRTRSLTAAVFAIVLVGCICFSYYSFLSLFFLVGIWALHEFYSLAEKMGYKPFRTLGTICGILTFMSIYALQLPQNCPDINFLRYAIYLVPFIIALQFLFTKREHPFHDFAFTVIGIFYCILPFALLVKIPVASSGMVNELATSYDYFKVLGIIFLIWANDTFAYIGGSMYGKHKMYERVSPGKTWEGTITGIICCVLVGFVLNLQHTFSSQWLWPLIAFFVGVFGTVGDLIESLIKRKAGVKDSGALMPGHGGVLDRFDSLLFVSPFVFVILKLAEGTH
jgi:phosphatidate cytidylyltransferase